MNGEGFGFIYSRVSEWYWYGGRSGVGPFFYVKPRMGSLNLLLARAARMLVRCISEILFFYFFLVIEKSTRFCDACGENVEVNRGPGGR